MKIEVPVFCILLSASLLISSFFIFTQNSFAQTNWLVRDSIALPTNNSNDFGMGAIYLDIQQDNVSLIVREIARNSQFSDPAKIRFRGDEIKLDLSDKQEVAFVNLPEGVYQIIEVNVPHFDLPFRISTDNRDVWRFSIVKNQINYLGTLKVGALRSKNAVNTVWLNQFATHLDDFKSRVASSQVNWPIGHGVAYNDPFFEFYQGGSND